MIRIKVRKARLLEDNKSKEFMSMPYFNDDISDAKKEEKSIFFFGKRFRL